MNLTSNEVLEGLTSEVESYAKAESGKAFYKVFLNAEGYVESGEIDIDLEGEDYEQFSSSFVSVILGAIVRKCYAQRHIIRGISGIPYKPFKKLYKKYKQPQIDEYSSFWVLFINRYFEIKREFDSISWHDHTSHEYHQLKKLLGYIEELFFPDSDSYQDGKSMLMNREYYQGKTLFTILNDQEGLDWKSIIDKSSFLGFLDIRIQKKHYSFFETLEVDIEKVEQLATWVHKCLHYNPLWQYALCNINDPAARLIGSEIPDNRNRSLIEKIFDKLK